MTQTIKQHLEVISTALTHYYRLLGITPEDSRSCKSLAAIEAKLDAPIKSAEEWRKLFNLKADCYGDYDDAEMRGFIEAIQADAIASKLPDVDLLQLAIHAVKKIKKQLADGRPTCGDALEIIHAALLKARGEI